MTTTILFNMTLTLKTFMWLDRLVDFCKTVLNPNSEHRTIDRPNERERERGGGGRGGGGA